MKKSMLVILIICSASCAKIIPPSTDNFEDLNSAPLVYDQDGVKVTITEGCPLSATTKANNYDETLTFIAENEDQNVTMYAAAIVKGSGVSYCDVYTQGLTQIGTMTYYKGRLIAFDLSSELDSIQEYDEKEYPTTKAKREKGEKYGACIKRVAKELNEKIEEDPLNAAACEVIKYCHVATLAAAVVICAKKSD